MITFLVFALKTVIILHNLSIHYQIFSIFLWLKFCLNMFFLLEVFTREWIILYYQVLHLFYLLETRLLVHHLSLSKLKWIRYFIKSIIKFNTITKILINTNILTSQINKSKTLLPLLLSRTHTIQTFKTKSFSHSLTTHFLLPLSFLLYFSTHPTKFEKHQLLYIQYFYFFFTTN